MTRTRTMFARAAAIGALAVLAAACGDAGGVGGGEESVTLAANPWPGSYANVAVAQYVLENELDVDVEVTEIDENAQWPGLAAGDIDAVLEVWPSGHEDNIQTYIEEDGTVEDIGELGALGQIGWFIPSYLLEDNPEFESWEGLEGNEEMFATAETGNSGQFLAADPSFVQYDEAIIDNLDLDFEVVQSGSEAAQLTAVQSAIDNEDPILFYFYTPHWMHAEYDLSMVELPEYTEECEEAPDEERDCGYPEDVLLKVANADLSENSPVAYDFLTNFQIETDQQDELTYLIDVEEMEPEEAAEQWLSDNPDVVEELTAGIEGAGDE
jgi:glycine betaine/proline transport system substrate-binding protein